MNSVKRHTARLLAVLTFGVLGMGLAILPAEAATAPSCVHTGVSTGTFTKTFVAHNTCAQTVRVRFILARHSDSDCFTLGHDRWARDTTARTAALARLDSC